MSSRSLILFFTLVFALGWSAQIAAIVVAGDLESAAAMPFLLAAMAAPTLVTVGFLIASPEARRALKWKPTWALAPLVSARWSSR